MINNKQLKNNLLVIFLLCLFFTQINYSLAKSHHLTDEEIKFTTLCQISTSGRTDCIEFVDHYCFVFDFEIGFISYNIEDPENPELLDTLALNNRFNPLVKGGHDFIIDGNTAIVDFMHSGINLVNISDPNNLNIISSHYDGLSGYYRIDYRDNRIYCAKAEDGFEILEILPNLTLNCIGSYSPDNIIMSHVYSLNNDLVYIADYERSSTLILNVSNPQNITEIKTFDWMAGSILFEEDIMYATIIKPDDEGLRIYNNSNPMNPILLGEITGFEAVNPLIIEDYIFLPGSKGLQIVNISDNSNPSEIIQYFDGEIAYMDVALQGNMVGLVDYEDSWYLLQIENLDLPITQTTEDDSNVTLQIVNIIPVFVIFNIILRNSKKRKE